ncbi:MAG: RNA polymerase-associated protein rapA [Gammaproteobacteria bacterium]|nr:RNA polymerase-associated protein rapA [Gammaproteobacteria bacterium]
MFKRSLINRAVFSALLLPGAVVAEVEVSGYVKNETSVFTRSGQVTGEAGSMLDDSGHDSGDLLKFENSARLFINGDLGENSSWHGEVNLIYDSEGVNEDYRGHLNYSQHDWLRELYIDTSFSDWDFRFGKQQVVWGTADGIKLLDIINPTDYRELVQNTMEDSRIPIWMIKAERNVGDSGNIQFIVSQVEENKIPGLNRNGDSGHPFIMKGVDSISGQANGFYNIAPALSKVATSFNNAAFGGAFGGVASPGGLVPFAGLSVEGFAGSMVDTTTIAPAMLLPGMPGYNAGVAIPGYIALNNIAQNGLFAGDPNGNNNVTNLMDVTGPTPPEVNWSVANPNSAFSYMSAASFATFNTFDGATTQWKKDYPDDLDTNAGFRYKGNLDNGLSYSVNYFYHYSANPDINMGWYDPSGAKLSVQRTTAMPIGGGFFAPDTTTSLTADQVPNSIFGAAPVSVLVHRGSTPGVPGTYYGTIDPTDPSGATPGLGSPVLRFTESLHRVHSIGASFDYALDTAFAPIVLRGEFLYDKDDKQAVIDKRLLSIGDLTNALTMEEADYFKYVLGMDVTVLKNLLISGQFIQFRNLDYKDSGRTCVSQTGISFDCSKYTGDLATLNLSNGMNKAYKNKEFYSLFLSKPFGPSDEHRWNNIVMYEEGGGFWNRFDMEYSFTDNLIGTAEWNHYWGDEDSQFGQFKDSSNIQVGIRYLFD